MAAQLRKRSDTPGTTQSTASAPVDLDQSVGFLLSQLGFAVSRRFGTVVGSLGIEPRQFALLRMIDCLGAPSQHALAEALQIPTSTMVALVDALEVKDLVERRTVPADRRTRTLHVTDEGAAVLREALLLAQDFEAEVCECLDVAERDALVSVLARIADRFHLVPGIHPNFGGKDCPGALPPPL